MMKLKVLRNHEEYEDHFRDVSKLCELAVTEMASTADRDVGQTIKNMDYVTWTFNKHCLMYRLYVKKDFSNDNGMLCILYDEDNPVSISGASKYNDDIVMLARRQYTLLPYRGKGVYHKYCMHWQIEWAKQIGAKACMITVNEYNKVLYKMLRRIPQGKATYFGGEAYYKYKSFIDLGGPHKINGADQYVMLKKLDDSFDERNITWEN